MDMLSKWGIRTITPMWRGVHSLGGAYDTDEGLTPLGVKICTLALERGITLDISHASRQSAEEILSLSRFHGIPPLASHSNFLGVHPHRRNLDDTLAKEVASLGGVIGISFVPSHLGEKEDLDAICAHLNYGCRLGLENALVLGTDYDGTDFLPYGLQGGIEDLYKLYSYLAQRGFSETFLEKLFYLNAHTYFSCKKDAQT
jgi:membrane dipeptidase